MIIVGRALSRDIPVRNSTTHPSPTAIVAAGGMTGSGFHIEVKSVPKEAEQVPSP